MPSCSYQNMWPTSNSKVLKEKKISYKKTRPAAKVCPRSFGPVKIPNKNDVLCGRGRVNQHSGNMQFREIVNLVKPEYVAETKKLVKKFFASNIVEHIRSMNPPGRFLKQDNDGGPWYEIGDEKAFSKTIQALRENAPQIRNHIKKLDKTNSKVIDEARSKKTAKIKETQKDTMFIQDKQEGIQTVKRTKMKSNFLRSLAIRLNSREERRGKYRYSRKASEIMSQNRPTYQEGQKSGLSAIDNPICRDVEGSSSEFSAGLSAISKLSSLMDDSMLSAGSVISSLTAGTASRKSRSVSDGNHSEQYIHCTIDDKIFNPLLSSGNDLSIATFDHIFTSQEKEEEEERIVATKGTIQSSGMFRKPNNNPISEYDAFDDIFHLSTSPKQKESSIIVIDHNLSWLQKEEEGEEEKNEDIPGVRDFILMSEVNVCVNDDILPCMDEKLSHDNYLHKDLNSVQGDIAFGRKMSSPPWERQSSKACCASCEDNRSVCSLMSISELSVGVGSVNEISLTTASHQSISYGPE